VPVADGAVWFKACAETQAFEPQLSAALFARWPDRVAEVLAHDDHRAWLLLADSGTPIGAYGNPPEAWLAALPLYAELQRGETVHTCAQLDGGVPDLRVVTLPSRYEELVQSELGCLDDDERARLVRFAPRFVQLCEELEALGRPATIQHDDLHHGNVYDQGGRLRVLDWGDSSIAHPFMSLVVTFRFLEEASRLPPDDPWFLRLRDAYLEPWGRGLVEEFELALRIGRFAHAIAWLRQRDRLPEEERPGYDRWFGVVLRRALAVI
jgi:hypothetical protein